VKAPSLVGSGAWTIASYGASLTLRMGSNIVLSRLLSPGILGVMVIVNVIRIGVELLSDVGIEQNIVHNKSGLTPEFLGTAWTLQVIRGLALSVIFAILAYPLAHFYRIDPTVLLAMSAAPFINSLASVSIFILVKNLRVKERNLFELLCESIAFVANVALGVALRNVWALVLGSLSALAIRAFISYRLPHPTHRVIVDRSHVQEIMQFGRWIAISSLVTYGSGYIDRIILARSLPLETLGIFGLAKLIAELPGSLANRVSYQIIFPAMALLQGAGPAMDRAILAAARWKFIMLAAVGLAVLTSMSDVAIRILYDVRYRAAGWMLFGMLIGAWFGVLSNINEATFLGLGRPKYNSLSSVTRFLVLAVGLPIGFSAAGLSGAIVAMVLSEITRFGIISIFQRKMQFGFARQDLMAVAIYVALTTALSLLRFGMGLGVAWDGKW
jgi:O-antigen/teichoic acid export membrane protein